MQKHIPVEQYTKSGEFIAAYPSIAAAARATGLKSTRIRDALFQNQYYSCGGYVWAHNAEDARIKIKINNLLENAYNQGATFILDSIDELEVLQARIKRHKATRMKTRLLDDGRIWVHLSKDPTKMKRLPPERKSNKPKWWLCYQVDGLDYRYAIDFGRGDTPEEAIEHFKYSRSLSVLNHKVVYIDRDYYRVLEYLLKYGGENIRRPVQTQTLVERSI